MKKIIIIASIFLSMVVSACIEAPNAVLPTDPLLGSHGVFVLSEGLWGSDNSALARIDIAGGACNINYFQSANPNLRLGDNASDIVIKGDTAFVAVSTSSTIEAFSKINGKSYGRIRLPENSQPRKIVIINDTTAYVTLLFKSAIAKFNPKTLSLQEELIATGPFPEGICRLGDYLYVANSGYGDYFYKQPKAGTISVIDLKSEKEIRNLPCGNNAIEVIASKKSSSIFAAYYNLPSLRDSAGGIVEYDATTGAEKRRWRLRATDITLSGREDTLFFLGGNTDEITGVYVIALQNADAKPELVIKNTASGQIWYSLTQSPDMSQIWVGNAKQFQSQGEVLIFNNRKDSLPVKKYPVTTNPNKILFF